MAQYSSGGDVIFKFPIGWNSSNIIKVPGGSTAKVLHIDHQHGTYQAWIECKESDRLENVEIVVVGTGKTVPDFAEYINTLQDGPFVWHFYRILR
jgi:hypothetical protein